MRYCTLIKGLCLPKIFYGLLHQFPSCEAFIGSPHECFHRRSARPQPPSRSFRGSLKCCGILHTRIYDGVAFQAARCRKLPHKEKMTLEDQRSTFGPISQQCGCNGSMKPQGADSAAGLVLDLSYEAPSERISGGFDSKFLFTATRKR